MRSGTVLVLGGSGMLGSMVIDVLARDESLHVVATVRRPELAEAARVSVPEADWRVLDVDGEGATAGLVGELEAAWTVNAIGLTKPYIHERAAADVERAVVINALLPQWLARAAARTGGRVLQIATDCVYSGQRGEYVETDAHDPLDVYGKTKSLGEVPSLGCHRLRCSIIGPEPKAHAFLLEWFRRQPVDASVHGFTNHRWNGVTTLQFARLCRAVIREDLRLPLVQHVVPRGDVSKHALLVSLGEHFERPDIEITPCRAPSTVNRTLRTTRPDVNLSLWAAAGYDRPPTIPEMVAELAAFDYRMNGLVN